MHSRSAVSASLFTCACLVACSYAPTDTDASDPTETATPVMTAQASLEQVADTGGLVTFVVRVHGNGMSMSAYQGTVTFNAGTLELVSQGTPASSGGQSFIVNTADFGGGRVRFAAFTPETFNGGDIEAFQFTVRPIAPIGQANLAAALNVVGTANGQAIRDINSGPRHLASVVAGDTCSDTGYWGDVNSDVSVDIIDAQQIARFGAGLSVADPFAVTTHGDVNSDATVNIIDAQQIARFSVSLSTAPRTGTLVC